MVSSVVKIPITILKACQIIRYLVDAEVGIRVKVVVFRGHILRGRFCRAFPLRNLTVAHTHITI